MKIKTLSILYIICVTSVGGLAQKSIDSVLRKYKNDEGVTNLNYSGKFSDYFTMQNGETLQSAIDIIDILVFNPKNDISASDHNKIEQLIQSNKFDLLADIKFEGRKLKIYGIDAGSYITHLYATVKAPEANVHLILSGKTIFEELSKLNLNFKGSDIFKEVLP